MAIRKYEVTDGPFESRAPDGSLLGSWSVITERTLNDLTDAESIVAVAIRNSTPFQRHAEARTGGADPQIVTCPPNANVGPVTLGVAVRLDQPGFSWSVY